MSVRKRPVITVVDARPMDEVGFRDARVIASGTSEIPKLSPPPPTMKGPPVSRPLPSSNLNTASSDSDAIYGVPRKPVASENRIPSDLTNALILDNHVNKSSHPPPPKPRRVGEPRPMTIHFDGLNNNNILPDRPLHPPAQKPVALKRASTQPDDTPKDASSNENSPVNTAAWNTNDWSLDASASMKVKPEVAAKRPTIIRVPTIEGKSEGGARPPPVATKSQAAKQHAAERMSVSDGLPSEGDGFVKPSTRPKPAVKAKPEAGTDMDSTEDRPQPSGDVRKRPTIIRPSSFHAMSTSNPPGSSNPAGPNSALPNALPRYFPPSETPSESIPASVRTAPTIIRPRSSAPGATTIRPEIPTKHPEKPVDASFPPQAKKRPNIIRPGVDVGRRVPQESTVTISSGAVHFSSTGTSAVSSEQRGTISLPDVPPERQNAENWKRIEMEDRQLTVPARHAAFSSPDPVGQEDGALRKPPSSSEQRQPPSKPPPPRVTPALEVRRKNTFDDSKSQSCESMAPLRPSGPPARPAAGPTTKPTRPPTQPTKRISSIADMAPALPQRPTLGHPLFHYVVAGPHAITLFDYKPTQPDELQFNAGSVILLEKWVNSEWLHGRTAQASGMFPCSFVDIIEAPAGAGTTTVAPVPSPSMAAEGGASSASWPGKGPRCCARFDYDGEDSADLAFAAGDVIRLVERVGNEWMKGELNGKVGMFPIGFVEIIEDLPPALESVNASHGGSEDGSTVLFDFLGQHGELSLLSGTRVKILGIVNSEWLYGEFEGEKGRFPRTFVDHVPSGLPHFEDQEPQKTTQDKVNDGPHCFALYDFVGQSPDDLSFSAGERISLVARVGDDWMKGEINGRRGIFPASFVQIVKDIDELPPRPKVTSPTRDRATLVDVSHNLAAHDASNSKADSALKEKSDSLPAAEKPRRAVAIYDFPGQTEDDLTFHASEVVEVTGVIDGDWMSGKIGERSGIFPASFVNILS